LDIFGVISHNSSGVFGAVGAADTGAEGLAILLSTLPGPLSELVVVTGVKYLGASLLALWDLDSDWRIFLNMGFIVLETAGEKDS
jgi:hypothetical protein